MVAMKSLVLSRVMVVVTALGALAGASCSGSSAPPAAVYITSTLGTDPTSDATLMATMSCTNHSPNVPFFTIGAVNSSQVPVPVSDGTSVDGNAIAVDCSVISTGAGAYTVELEVSQGSIGGITFYGNVSDIKGPQSGIQASFTTAVAGSAISFSTSTATTCSITLDPDANPPITAGRIWGSLSCPLLADSEANATCDGQATQFLFQNCAGE